MIISKTPFRISFFGGGTDYPAYFREHGGAVLATSFDKYCYISVRALPPFFGHKYRIVYSAIENVHDIAEIQHPAVRGVLQWSHNQDGLEIHHNGDLPARSGLGSSSAFTVGLVHALKAYAGKLVTKQELADAAIHIEQDLLHEYVGCQDQIVTAFGGFNKVLFCPDGSYQVQPLIIDNQRLKWLERHLMLFFTGISRYSSDIAKSTIENIQHKQAALHHMHQMVDEAVSLLNNPATPLSEFGRLLHEAWVTKRSISNAVSTPLVDEIYAAARQAGAIGGKLLGAGGGGFVLLFVEPPNQQRVREQLRQLVHVPLKFEQAGSRIVLYQPDDFE
ncbi:MAG: kinase [Candidatus Sericytochromatia bacterium]